MSEEGKRAAADIAARMNEHRARLMELADQRDRLTHALRMCLAGETNKDGYLVLTTFAEDNARDVLHDVELNP